MTEPNGQTLLLVTTIVGFVATLTTQLLTRRWSVQDRDANVRLVVVRAQAEAEALRIHTASIAEQLRSETAHIAQGFRNDVQATAGSLIQIHDRSLATVTEKLEEVRVQAKEAYTEANHVNIKIENLNQRLLHEEKPTVPAVPIEVAIVSLPKDIAKP